MAELRHLQVHGVEEGIASVETEEGRLFELPAWMLPGGARTGDRLIVRTEGGSANSLGIVVERDRQATNAARDEAVARLRRLSRGDEGGDLDL